MWVIPADGGEARQITDHLEGDFSPQWSPDGKSLVFTTDRTGSDSPSLWRVAASGGPAEKLTDGPAWYSVFSPDGAHVYFVGYGDKAGSLWRVPAGGGAARRMTELEGKPGALGNAALATDGEHLYFAWEEDLGDIWVMDVVTAKDLKKRRRDVGDVRVELEEALEAPSAMPAADAQRALGWRTLLAAVVVMVIVFIGLMTVWSMKPSAPRAVARFEIALPSADRLTITGTRRVALSPDGTQLVYAASNQLYLRAIDRVEPTLLSGTSGWARNPFFSPDGQWVGFFLEGELKKLSLESGAVVTLADVALLHGASWETDGTILFGQNLGGILRVSENGGTPEVLVPPEEGLRFYGPQILPGGRDLLFTLTRVASATTDVVAQSLETGERHVLIEGGSDGRYIPTGHLVYAVGSTVFAMPFDPARLEATGAFVPVIEDVMRGLGSVPATAQLAFSKSGSLAYIPEAANARVLVWVDRDGRETAITEKEYGYRAPRLSPDGERLAFAMEGDIWIYDIGLDTQSRLTTEGSNSHSLWSPDGAWIVFASVREGEPGLYRKRTDFTGPAELLLQTQHDKWPTSWSPDGKLFFFHEETAEGGSNLFVLSLDGEAQPYLMDSFMKLNPVFSPDGKWSAYSSDESGRFEVYDQPFPGPGRRWTVSSNGGWHPVWSPVGRELFYLEEGKLMVVDVQTVPKLRLGGRRQLFEIASLNSPIRQYDVAPDGERFVTMSMVESRQTMTIVLNWFEELERLVPTDH